MGGDKGEGENMDREALQPTPEPCYVNIKKKPGQKPGFLKP
jgi:hypothetical protein